VHFTLTAEQNIVSQVLIRCLNIRTLIKVTDNSPENVAINNVNYKNGYLLVWK